MKWLQTIFREIFGLFVDDGLLALAVLIWLGFLKLLALHFPSTVRYDGLLLFCGLGLILAESALRYARRGKR